MMTEGCFENLCVGIKWVQAVGEAERLSEKDGSCEKLGRGNLVWLSKKCENWSERKLEWCEYLM